MAQHIAVPPILNIGGGALREMHDVIARLGASRALIVTDAFLSSTGLAARLAEDLTSSDIPTAIFDGTVPDPTTASLEAGVDAVHAHRADVIIGLGGGSPIDSAKALAVLARRGGTMSELKAPVQYTGSALPIVAVPTTAGTGSEATQFTVITDSETGEKMLCGGPSYLPTAALVDYELTLTMPQRLTADTGLDALTHAVEAYVSSRASGFSDAVALQAIRQIGQHLRRAVADGTDRGARSAMMEAATLAGIAFSNSSVALVHGMSRPLGAHFHVAHGMANAMLFAAVTEFSLGVSDARYADCARALGVATERDDDSAAARALVAELPRLSVELEVPSPRAFGISSEAWEQALSVMAEQALASGSPANNPRIPEHAEIVELYRRIYDAR